MNKQRFLVFAIVIVVFVVIVGVMWVYITSPPAPEECPPSKQEELVIGFKGDAVVLGLLGAIAAAALYSFMLRYQIFFPGTDLKRFFSAAAAGMILAFVLIIMDSLYGPTCLKKALGAESSIPEELARIRSLAGLFVGNVWLAIGIDQLLFAIVSTGLVRALREARLRYL